jgi:hypothetical protein
VALQVFVVVGGVSGLIPLTGKALPFLAAGGSSTLANWLLTGILLKLSDAAGRNELEPAPESSGVIAPPRPAVVAEPAPATGAVPGQGEVRDDDTMYLRATPREAAAPTPPAYGAPTVHGTANRSTVPGAAPGVPGYPGAPEMPSTGTQPDTPTF